jgi:hypothetical protein
MELLGFDNNLSGVATQALSLSAIPVQASFLSPNTYGLSRQSDSNSQIPLIQFDVTTGWLQIAGDAGNNIVKQTVTNNGYYQFDIDGNIFSSDRDSSFFLQSLAGATSTSVVGINFDGGLGYDTLIVGNQVHSQSFGVIADDKIQIQGEVHSESIFFKAQDIVNQGAILAQNVTAEFSNSYTDVADAKITASNSGNILLNGGKTGNLQANGQFLANGTVGGKIDFRAKTIGLSGANLDASGENGGGTILIGGDYQGGDSTGLGTLANAQSTFINKNSIINANAFTNGNGGKVIVWSDINTNFQGNINARGGEVTGDGGFVEVSGKQNLNFVGEIDVKANSGKTGSILLDPTDLIINGDDGDESTFDISDLQKLEGDITLSATNDIIFNTMGGFGDNESDRTINLDAGNMVSFNAPFSIYATTVNINAGGIVNFYDSFYANGGNLNIYGASITGFGSLESLNSMSLTSRDAINLENSTIRNYGDGEIVLNAGTYINLGGLYFDSGNSVNVNLSANEDIDIYSIYSNGNIQDFSAVSTIGDINLERQGYGSGDLYASGNIALDAYGDIVSSGFVLSGSSVNILSRTGKIDTDRAHISSAVNGLNAGDITLKADTSIYVGELLAYGEKTGGNVNVSANGNVIVGSIETFTSIGGKSGDISVVSTQGDIYLGYYGNAMPAINANGDNKIGGKVVLNAYGSVGSTNIYAGAYTDGVGSSVNIISQTGSITVQSGRPDIGNEISTSSGSGNAGNVILNSAFDIKVGNIATKSSAGGDVYSINGGANTLEYFGITEGSVFASSSGSGNGGYVNLTASRDIETLNISTTSINGNAGNVEITANGDILTKAIASNVTNSSGNGGNITLNADLGITVGSIDASTNGDASAGDVRLNAGFDSDINVLAIKTNVDGKGDGGEVYINGGGDIVVDSVRADSTGGKAGNIRLIASKTVRVTGAFSINGEDYSLYTDAVDDASGAKGGNVTIEHSSKITDSLSPFIIGDASKNGTFAGVSDGVLGLMTKPSSVHRIAGGEYVFDNIKIIGQNQNTLSSIGISIPVDYFDNSDVFLSFVFDSDYLFNQKAAFLANGIYNGFTLQQLKEIAKDTPFGEQLPSLNIQNAQKLLDANLNFYLYLYGITTPRTKGHFIAQSLAETGSFSSFIEANGSGPGVGLLQLTGTDTQDDNLDKFGRYVGISGLTLKTANLIASNLSLNILSAMWVWSVYGKESGADLNTIAQNNPPNSATVDIISRKVRGDLPNVELPQEAHFEKRLEYFKNAIKVLNIT